MSGKGSQHFRVGDWLVEPDLGRVSRGSERASLRPREMDLLAYFARRPREVLRTDDIIATVWSGVHVTNDSLYFSISQLRKVLDEGDADRSIIETIPKRGYRLMAEVTPVDSAPTETPEPSVDRLGDGKAETADGPASQDPGEEGSRRLPTGIWGIAATLVVAAGIAWFVLTDDMPTPAAAPTAAANVAPDANSIAVMPFIDLTPEADYTYFSDGITEEILNRLTGVRDLRVAARTSSFTFKDSSADVIEIGRSLGVANLLEGSVRKEGNRVRVAVQLIDATSGFQLWSDSYDRQLTSVFDIQNEISHRVAEALKITLGNNGAAGDRSGRPATADVLDEYLLGLEAIRTQSFDSLARAVRHFETVREMDPSFSAATVQLAKAHLELLNTGASNDLARAVTARSLLRAVIAEDPDNAAAHRVMGKAEKFLGNPMAARRELDLALQLAPSDSEALVHLSHVMSAQGDIVESRQLLDRALRLDPFSSDVLRSYAILQQQFGLSDVALQAMQRASELHPDNPNHYYILGSLQAQDQGSIARALDNFLRAAELDPVDYEIAAYVAATYLALGLNDEASRFIQRADDTGPQAPTTLALHAMRAALDGRNSEARARSLDALELDSMRIYTHSVITRTFLPIIVNDAIQGNGLEDAIARLEALHLSAKVMHDEVSERTGLDSRLAFSDLSRTWLVSLAVLYDAAGMTDKLTNALDGLALTRIDALGEYRDSLRNDDYLLEAEVLSLQGDVEGAFAMLNLAVENDLVYLWQFLYAENPALNPLKNDARWDALVARIEARVDAERELVTRSLGMVLPDVEAD